MAFTDYGMIPTGLLPLGAYLGIGNQIAYPKSAFVARANLSCAGNDGLQY